MITIPKYKLEKTKEKNGRSTTGNNAAGDREAEETVSQPKC